MNEFDPAAYGPVFAELLAADRRRALDAGSPDPAARDRLADLTVESAFAHTTVNDRPMARCCLSGAWLLHDLLDESHTLSQSIDTPEGSFWHGIMHRREGDFGNAKYWFRRVGDHSVFDRLADQFGDGDPFAFVDRCEAAVRHGEGRDACLEQQQAEWELLFDWCYGNASQQQADGRRK